MIKSSVQKLSAYYKSDSGRTIAFMSMSGLLNNILTIVSGLFVARWLIAEELGLFNSFNVIAAYVILIQLGVPSGLSRQMPFYKGKGEEIKALECIATANLWGAITGLFCIGVALFMSIYFFINKNYSIAAGVLVVGITSFQGLYVTKYLKVLYRSNNDFNKLTVIDLINSVVSFVGIYLVWRYKFYGLCGRSIISAIIDLLFTYYWRPIKVKQQWNKARFNELMKVGFPIFWVANVYSLWPMIQRTMILSLGNTKALGLFSLASIVESTMKTLTNTISNISFPRMAFEWGQSGNLIRLIKIPLKPVLVSTAINTLLAIIGWFTLPYFINNFLPNYAEGLMAAKWMLWVGWLGSFSVFANIYIVIQKNLDRLVSYVVGVFVWLACSFLINKTIGFDIVIFPIATLIGLVVIYSIDIFNFRRYYMKYKRDLKVNDLFKN